MTTENTTMKPAAGEAPAIKHITCYFDVISPYAFLAFERLPEALKGVSYSVAYTPVLFMASWALRRSRPSATGLTGRCCGWRTAWALR